MSEIWIRHRYVTDPPYDYSVMAWLSRPPPACDGPRPTTVLRCDSENEAERDRVLDTVLARAHRAFGDPDAPPQMGPMPVKKPVLEKPKRARR